MFIFIKSYKFMFLLIVLLPLLASLITGIFGRFLGFKGAGIITSTCVLWSALLSIIVFYEVALSGSSVYIKLSPWFFSEMFDCCWGFYFDSLTAVMLIVVCFVSFLVHIYSLSYMSTDAHIPRFMSYLSIFTFFMLTLITADNFIQMFFGWEGVGLASYLLISFWFTRLQASKSSIKAMLMNRVGDFGLALGIMGVFFVFKTVDFAVVFAIVSEFTTYNFIFCNIEKNALNVICILLFIGAVGKSAQLPLQTWLPDAMEGPTPVSALIHAATMVTAGVFMIARCSPMFEFSPTAKIVITLVGAMTCFFAATTGIVQNDLKRVIAYSTCSQLGYMVFACGISNYSAGVFHLMNHAFFKALLFLSAGSVIHAIGDIQDMRKMGGIVQLLPLTYAMMLIGSFSLAGFPFLTGFYSKDLILELAYAKYTFSGNFAYWLGIICVCFTSYYSFRLLFLTFLSNNAGYKNSLIHAHDANLIMCIPLIFLAFGSIFYGYIFKDMMVGLGTDFWGNSILMLPKNVLLLESEYIPQIQKLLPLFFTILGLILAFMVNYYYTKQMYLFKQTKGSSLYYMLNKRWFFDKVYNDFIGKNFMSFGYHISFKTLDKGCFEILGPFGISSFFKQFTYHISKLQSGMIYHYAVIMLIGLTLYITIIMGSFLENFNLSKYYFIYFTSFLFYNYYSRYIKISR
jgi:proton-translocating NADH-quinone oxidoreductase chain L